MRRLLEILFTCLIMNVSAGGAAAGLLVNPGAETGDLTGWTKGGDSNPFVDAGSFNSGINPHSGRYAFAGGTGALGTLTQNVPLAGISGITDALIDAGAVSAAVSFWEQGLNQGSTSDNGYVSLTFRDASHVALGTVSSAVIDSHNLTWAQYFGSFPVPSGTRSIDYTMNFTRNAGLDNDSYFDDNDLSIFTSARAVPEPAGHTLCVTGVVAALAFSRRRRVPAA